MRRLILLGVAMLVLAVAAIALARGGGIAAIGRRPGRIESLVAPLAWRLLVPAHARDAANPVPATADVLKEAGEHWAEHCALCHDNNGSGDTSVGRRVYPPVPDLRDARVQRLTDGELFYAIENGVPWSAMPGWTTGTPDGERQSWALVRFVRHLPAITAGELKEMEAINPRPPVSAETQRETDAFLKPRPKRKSGK